MKTYYVKSRREECSFFVDSNDAEEAFDLFMTSMIVDRGYSREELGIVTVYQLPTASEDDTETGVIDWDDLVVLKKEKGCMNLYYITARCRAEDDEWDNLVVAQTGEEALEVWYAYMSEAQEMDRDELRTPTLFEIPAFPHEKETAQVLPWHEGVKALNLPGTRHYK